MAASFSEQSGSEFSEALSSASWPGVEASSRQMSKRPLDASLPVTLINAPMMAWPEDLSSAASSTGFSLHAGCVVIQQGRIIDVSKTLPASLLLNHDNVSIITLPQNSILTPGLIDLQLNGAFGIDFNHASLKQVTSLLWQLPKYGITHAMATLISAPLTDMLCALQLLEEAASIWPDISFLDEMPETLASSEMLGIHLEGPFLNARFSGVHPLDALGAHSPCLTELKALLSPSVRMMTYAPERDVTGDMLQCLLSAGVTPMAGHCNPDPEQLRAMVKTGLRGVTHLFNAMPPFHHRNAGCLPEILLNPDLYATWIGDGEHVCHEAMRLVQAVKPNSRIALVSDAMALAGRQSGETFDFAGQSVTRIGNRVVNAAGQLAGSVLLLNEMVAFLAKAGWMPFEQAVYQASAIASDLIGESGRIGRIAPGLEASLVVWQADCYDILATWQRGELAYHRDNSIAGLQTSQSTSETVSRQNPLDFFQVSRASEEAVLASIS
ncbi:MAG: amidohydrolase family protein [Vampirovibrionales bacterium]|nr:amidohydrolase family protein [Vampirovibrionales bacterium]